MAKQWSHLPDLCLASASPRRRDLLERLGFTPKIHVPKVDESQVQTRAEEEAEAQGLTALAKAKAILPQLSLAKARACWQELETDRQAQGQGQVSEMILAADTLVYSEAGLFGKPRDEAEAIWMLEQLCGREQSVLTAMTLALPWQLWKAKPKIEEALGTLGWQLAEHRESTQATADDSRLETARTQTQMDKQGMRYWTYLAQSQLRFYALDSCQRQVIREYVALGTCMDKAGAYGIQDEGALLVESIRGDYETIVGLPLAVLGRSLSLLNQLLATEDS